MANVKIMHRFAASAGSVYDAWLDPEQARRFLYATATGEIVRCDVNACVGGKYAIVDRRNGADVLHEGTYLELQRPRRIVFRLRVPKYSSDENRVTIEIKALGHGCELTLTARTADNGAEDTRRGWMMILEVLDEMLPADVSTCGTGLAQHAAVPRRIAIYLAELAETLELHRTMLVLKDAHSKNEDDAYCKLAASYRSIAAELRVAAERMSAQRDLPMGTHDEDKWTDTHIKAFARFVHEQSALVSLLHVAAARDEQMLASMQQPG